MKQAKKMKRTFTAVDDIYDTNKMIERLQSYVNKHPTEFQDMLIRATDTRELEHNMSFIENITPEQVMEMLDNVAPKKYDMKQLDI